MINILSRSRELGLGMDKIISYVDLDTAFSQAIVY
jgi:hypothetical protein